MTQHIKKTPLLTSVYWAETICPKDAIDVHLVQYLYI